ncbi:MAG: ATP-binding cassette domain-containing protein [Synergistaceae bacterium]|jgi:alpha-D-ribose 1-methylphosphonate 5-triphosphate synthase subunit PhnL|nr:ATP-binding cassette domain-containing protein [Synergistaceae bacterium]
MNTVLQVRNLSKDFYLYNPGRVIDGCRDVSFSLREKEFLGITGASGSGKSTILKCIYQTYRVKSGEIFYFSPTAGCVDLTKIPEREITRIRRQEIGYVSQFLETLPRVTARQIVEDSALEAGVSREEAQKAAEEVLNYFKLPLSLWDIYPYMFSGGEKLRLNLAKAMVKTPRLLLLDEPTASLDEDAKKLVKELLQKLIQKGTAMIGIFHDLDFMRGLCDHVYNMAHGGEAGKGNL